MSSFDFIVENIKFSYSSVSTFDNCPYSFKLSYIDDVKPRVNNFFAEYGTLIHKCIEAYFKGEMEIYELSDYYKGNYDLIIQTSPPPNPPGMGERYMEQGTIFFDNFSTNRDDFEIVLSEEKIDFQINGINFTARPDLVLKEKHSGKICLYDYKSSTPFKVDRRNGRETRDEKKLEGYYKQLFIYTYALRKQKGIKVKDIILWFTRPERKLIIPWKAVEEQEAIEWLLSTVEKIKNEELFPYNNTSPYFCENICSVRNFCEFR